MTQEPLGSFVLVLHSHMPYVLSHGRWPHGTDWLTEAASNCYLPLLDALYGLVEQGISPKATIGVTPVLAEQLSDPAFVYEFTGYLRAKIESAEADEKHFRGQGDEWIAELARRWRDNYARMFGKFCRVYGKSIVGAFRELQDAGHVEMITSGATHGYFPLLSSDASIRAQVKQGVATYKKHFARDPKGFWLPECAYRPAYEWSSPLEDVGNSRRARKGVEEVLAENGISYFISEEELLRGEVRLGKSGEKSPALGRAWGQFNGQQSWDCEDRSANRLYRVAESDVAVFSRDPWVAGQVWCPSGGYPADEWYMEFHKQHFPGGLRYWRVTGRELELDQKDTYDPERASERCQAQAEHFVTVVKDRLREHRKRFGEAGVVCAAYDTELFGHWWHEGADWLGRAIGLIAEDPEIRTVTGSECLEMCPPRESVHLQEGSWGEGRFHWKWLNPETEWTWKPIYEAEAEMVELASKFGGNGATRRVLQQAARELFLLQSSDWQFNITARTSADYSEARIRGHYENFRRLADLARTVGSGGTLSERDHDFLDCCEERDQLFAETEPEWWGWDESDIMPASAH